MTPAQIVAVAPAAAPYADAIIAACADFKIADVHEQAMWLAQLSHECQNFRTMKELWGPTPQQVRYASRIDLGNTKPEAIAFAKAAGVEVGRFYAGHGGIQTTGYNNHLAYSMYQYGDNRCAKDPTMPTRSPDCILSAAWYWSTNNLSRLAAPGTMKAFTQVSARINCGNANAAPEKINGLHDRIAWWEKWQAGLGIEG